MSTSRPILFNDEMVRAILDGRKTVTRRVVDSIDGMGRVTEFQASDTPGYAWTFRDRRLLWNDLTDSQLPSRCPFGKPGDRLLVRESGKVIAVRHSVGGEAAALKVQYRADGAVTDWMPLPKRMGADLPSWALKFHHVPNGVFREASRITLEITDIRCQRLQDISEEDAIAEGVVCPRLGTYGMNHETVFRDLWDSIANPGAKWDDAPWVWAISFKRVEA